MLVVVAILRNHGSPLPMSSSIFCAIGTVLRAASMVLDHYHDFELLHRKQDSSWCTTLPAHLTMFISKVPVPPGILCKVVWANRSYCSNHVFWRVAKQCHLNQAETRPVNGHESSIIPLLHSFHRAFPVFYLCKKKHRIHRLSPVYDGS